MSIGKDQSIRLTVTCSDTEIVIRADKEIYTVWKKLPEAQNWGDQIVQRLIGMEFEDRDILPGTAYEYKITNFNGATGYILAGSKIPLRDNMGKLILIVENTHASALAVELARFQADIVGEGWTLIRHDVSRTDSPESVKAIIKAEYDADPANVKTVILFGSIPVKLSGPVNYDGHGEVMVAADTFYGCFGDWSGSPSILPAPMSLAIGRIDFSGLTNFFNKPNNPRSELDLLREYLNRNHAFRTGQINIPPIAAVVDSFSDRDFASNAWRNFPPLVSRIEEIPPNTYFT